MFVLCWHGLAQLEQVKACARNSAAAQSSKPKPSQQLDLLFGFEFRTQGLQAACNPHDSNDNSPDSDDNSHDNSSHDSNDDF